jgi:drug/metabolite transporter superfamily protein YnfA
MDQALLSDSSRVLAGILFLSLVTVETGGLYLVRVVTGRAGTTPFQEKFARAGHAHAGVLLVLALVCQVFVDQTDLTGAWEWLARAGVALAALLMPGGFFFSSMGAGRLRPNRLIALVFAGAGLLALSLATLGVGLLTAG